MNKPTLTDLVHQRIEQLRPKLLDLTRRNPLLSTKFSDRSSAHIRVVDELPDVLFYKLNNGQKMKIVSLPEISGDPKDEETKDFRDALAAARLTDQDYQAALDTADRESEKYIDEIRSIERALKDRLRAERGMPPRSKQADISVSEHAKNHGISATYDLPTPDKGKAKQKHVDNDIQTLLLQKDLERKLNGITTKCRTWIQETGINVLHVAYGFLEWSEPGQADVAFAPLVLSGAQIEKVRTRDGVQFFVSGSGDEPETNSVLAEKLKLDFGIILPQKIENSVEEYLAEVASIAPKRMHWRLRRQVAIGVFPSARMAMYHDINPKAQDFCSNDTVNSLLAGTNVRSAQPFAEEYNIDEPEVEKCVPYTVMDADSSQFSALVDISKGRNLAIEGPPGTGKSQTIVNAIAAALAEGKKVLFVAEKLAALDVVKSRLEAIGLGEFLLPLQAEKSSREQVIESVRQRLSMAAPADQRQYAEKLERLRSVRSKLQQYIDLQQRIFGSSGMSVHEILGKGIRTSGALSSLPIEIVRQCSIDESLLNKGGIEQLQSFGKILIKVVESVKAARPNWQGVTRAHIDRFTAQTVCELSKRAALAFRRLSAEYELLSQFGISSDAPENELVKLSVLLADLGALTEQDRLLYVRLLRPGAAEAITGFVGACEEVARKSEILREVLCAPLSVETAAKVTRTIEVCHGYAFSSLDTAALRQDIESRATRLAAMRDLFSKLEKFAKTFPGSASCSIASIRRARHIYLSTKPEVLAFRNPAHRVMTSTNALRRCISEGRLLQNDRSRIATKLSLAVNIPQGTLSQAIIVLRASGPLSFLSKRYREARRLARGVYLAAKFRNSDAIESLEQLAVFKAREQAFLSDKESHESFGEYFRGLETDFASFEALIRFYEQVDKEFENVELRGLQAFLREASYDRLASLPELPPGEDHRTMLEIGEFIKVEEEKIGLLRAGVLELDHLLSNFFKPKELLSSDLQGILGFLQDVLERVRSLSENREAASVLNERFAGSDTVTAGLQAACDWAFKASAYAKIIERVSQSASPESVAATLGSYVSTRKDASSLCEELCNEVGVTKSHFMKADAGSTADVLGEAALDEDGLIAHSDVAAALIEATNYGVLPLVQHWIQTAEHNDFDKAFEALVARQLAKKVYAKYQVQLSSFKGRSLDQMRSELRQLDKEVILLARKVLARKVFKSASPPQGNGAGKKSEWTELALLENETSKQQRYIAVRELTKRAGRALLELKPCWMMSPLAVAQYVPKEAIKFDLCIIDEASQMPPESAIGALVRSAKAVVVGDTNQLPPSNFFKKILDDDDANEDEAVLNESILEMANATFRPARRLRWHYRSRHSGLIKFSNRHVYKDDLIVFPSPTESLVRMGVEYRRVEGIYKSGTNQIEARAIVDAVLEFMREEPERSLGVVTLNQKQRELILEEFENALAKDEDAQGYIEAWRQKNDGLEEFFIKNLENVQGDERDVIFIGTVYGPESPGAKVAQRFGPINGTAGKRRLNVLFSRAKEKIVTFSSMTAADIAADPDTNPGVHMLKSWLEYTASGMLDAGVESARETGSEFEQFVIDQVRAMGLEAVEQVGVAGYFVDIGVKHPNWPHGFLLGVECDGASYHSAKSARDRDRLRQDILEGLGWYLHRIWSTDWFADPRAEAMRLRSVVEKRLADLQARSADFAPKPTKLVNPKPPEQKSALAQMTLPLEKASKEIPKPGKGVGNAKAQCVEVGDTVRVKYLDGDRSLTQFTISSSRQDLQKGIVHKSAPIAIALLGAEKGETIEVLVGTYVRPAVVEEIDKA